VGSDGWPWYCRPNNVMANRATNIGRYPGRFRTFLGQSVSIQSEVNCKPLNLDVNLVGAKGFEPLTPAV